MNSLKELQLQAIHGMLGVADFLEFRKSLYQTLILQKYKHLVPSGADEVSLSRKECEQVEVCLEIFKYLDITDDQVVEKSFYLLKSLSLHFQVVGIYNAIQKGERAGLIHDVDYQVFTQENLLDKLNPNKTFFNNLKTFEALFAKQKKALTSYCEAQFPECYDLINGLCEG